MRSTKTLTTGDIIADLMQSIQDEGEAAADYRKRAALTTDPTQSLYLHIADEEDAHQKEFTDELARLNGSNLSENMFAVAKAIKALGGAK